VAIATKGWEKALADDAALALGANVINGTLVQPGVAAAFGKEAVSLNRAMRGKLCA
jgi:alanine dehydrogenase